MSDKKSEPICPACNGSGQIATGCDEWSSTICKGCEGTGMREAGILGPDADGLPIARYSHRAHGMAEHPNGTWVRYSEVAGRIRAAQQAQADAGAVPYMPANTREAKEYVMREDFERWAKPRGYSLERTTDSYKSQGTKSAWRGWRAAMSREKPETGDE